MSGNIDAAIDQWKQVLAISPDDLFATYNLGLGHFQKQEQARGYKIVGKCILINPEYIPAHQNLATAAVMAGDFDRAIYRWQQISQLQPTSPEPQMVLGDLHFRAGNLQEAKRTSENLLDALKQVDLKESG